jgi:Flp pilus assembly protein TadG
MMRKRRRLDRTGSTAVEFAIVSAVFLPLCLAIMQLGVLMWAQGTMQSTASQVARCLAIGSPSCTGSNSGTSYATSTWEQWIFSQITGSSYMTVTPTAGLCSSSISYVEVQITCTYWGWLTNPFITGGKTKTLSTLTATAYFPSGTC